MTKKDKIECNILEAIVSTIVCTKCEKEESGFLDTFEMVDCLISEGWYATEKNVWCPECNKKRLKK